ncbi:hypothetical protein B0H67DRAFT_663812 [Lasiosphaeris hirsuta]|uniref:Uncharacterized protein n=1 Tax=Lasiosphaeris hirsuta TaxID=260670 RepID=A0AA40E159_9PEZI|nr:hypothetical protein B0H67DRAFT_663812 [Lasiosphaeris hirsuta]
MTYLSGPGELDCLRSRFGGPLGPIGQVSSQKEADITAARGSMQQQTEAHHRGKSSEMERGKELDCERWVFVFGRGPELVTLLSFLLHQQNVCTWLPIAKPPNPPAQARPIASQNQPEPAIPPAPPDTPQITSKSPTPKLYHPQRHGTRLSQQPRPGPATPQQQRPRLPPSSVKPWRQKPVATPNPPAQAPRGKPRHSRSAQTPDLESQAEWESPEVPVQDPPDPQQGGVVAAKRGAEPKEEVKREGSAVVGRTGWPDVAVALAETPAAVKLADGLRCFVFSLVIRLATSFVVFLSLKTEVVAPPVKLDRVFGSIAQFRGLISGSCKELTLPAEAWVLRIALCLLYIFGAHAPCPMSHTSTSSLSHSTIL